MSGIPVLTGAAIGLDEKTLPGLVFDITGEYVCCLICGDVYQSELDRAIIKVRSNYPLVSKYDQEILDIELPRKLAEAKSKRDLWAYNHRRKHSEKAHLDLRRSGRFCTPEAALKLSPLGIIPLEPSNEMAHAMFEAPRAPQNDVEGT